MSQIIHSYNFLLALKAGEVHVLKTRSPEEPPFSQTPVYQHAYQSIRGLNSNQKGKFHVELRTSRDGLTLAAVCTYDGESAAGIPQEYRRKYKPRKKVVPKKVAPKKVAPSTKFTPLSVYMKAHHEGRKVEVFDKNKWRPVEPGDWTTIGNENFRVSPIRVAVFWNLEADKRAYAYDISNERLEELYKSWKNVKVFVEEV